MFGVSSDVHIKPGLLSLLRGNQGYPKQWSEMFEEFKEKQKEDEEMIKLTRDDLIVGLSHKLADLSKRLLADNVYWSRQLVEEISEKSLMLRSLFRFDESTDFELVALDYSEQELNPDSMETCEVEIADEGAVPDKIGISLNWTGEPSVSGPEWGHKLINVLDEKDKEIERLKADADRREEKIELLNKMIVDLERQHDSEMKELCKESVLTKWSDQFPVNKSHGEDITVFEALTIQDQKIAQLTMLCERIEKDVQSLMFDEDEEDDE